MGLDKVEAWMGKSMSSFAAIFRGGTPTIASRARGRRQAEAYPASETFGEEAINDGCNCFLGVKKTRRAAAADVEIGSTCIPPLLKRDILGIRFLQRNCRAWASVAASPVD